MQNHTESVLYCRHKKDQLSLVTLHVNLISAVKHVCVYADLGKEWTNEQVIQ